MDFIWKKAPSLTTMLEMSLPLNLETKCWIKDFYSTSVHQSVFSYSEQFDIFFVRLFINYNFYNVYLINTSVVLNHAVGIHFFKTFCLQIVLWLESLQKHLL